MKMTLMAARQLSPGDGTPCDGPKSQPKSFQQGCLKSLISKPDATERGGPSTSGSQSQKWQLRAC